jgi:hypothetical protein
LRTFLAVHSAQLVAFDVDVCSVIFPGLPVFRRQPTKSAVYDVQTVGPLNGQPDEGLFYAVSIFRETRSTVSFAAKAGCSAAWRGNEIRRALSRPAVR